MGEIVAEHAENGVPDFIMVLVFLSVALGFFNLLPFPALDGGRLVFLGYELITRKRPNERFEAMVHTVGILFLLAVLVLVTFRDIVG
jgi:regulator of sigma E protease